VPEEFQLNFKYGEGTTLWLGGLRVAGMSDGFHTEGILFWWVYA